MLILLSSMTCDDSQITDYCRTHTFFDEDSLSSGQVKCIGSLSCLVKKKALIDFTTMLEVKISQSSYVSHVS